MAEYEKKKGLSEIDAIFEYVKLARGLDTFGIHFFLVRVRDQLSMEYLYAEMTLGTAKRSTKDGSPSHGRVKRQNLEAG